ncbi:hypothetical protein X801_06245, partial [Opisthorchis viverrini]|uniref:Uncharacterized protein n=2 Tax=Opisthorchis viverrini TaxID=6198 RepID=A0A075AAX5_OPIVI
MVTLEEHADTRFIWSIEVRLTIAGPLTPLTFDGSKLVAVPAGTAVRRPVVATAEFPAVVGRIMGAAWVKDWPDEMVFGSTPLTSGVRTAACVAAT